MRKIKLNMSLPEEAAVIQYNTTSIFSEVEEAAFYLHHYHRWDQHSKIHNFETHYYTNDIRSGVDILYRRLFAVLIEYTGSSIDEDSLFMIYTTFHNALYFPFIL
ncbi:uncharacterized protein ACA1_220470 [Acanthamoeba castellanii str. Neff]|uniref:Uncharacterized protein n=1 Tax=Acanthamoeba castellanii (strain ATCC 30010 / Neff) TaxID=1257118 RepID=L8GRL6_ACACF|nr:uncharacterized protein ACA1_220470 [Acanthamoeba castellanii str. Neff]ELR15288.1 hypothetical protein ACA1_220470 [Acanthamoeba castellanii str. Neff]